MQMRKSAENAHGDGLWLMTSALQLAMTAKISIEKMALAQSVTGDGNLKKECAMTPQLRKKEMGMMELGIHMMTPTAKFLVMTPVRNATLIGTQAKKTGTAQK